MGRADYYEDGGYNVVCALTGFKMKRSQCRMRWDNQLVRKESWEPRHPQDFLRAKPDWQQVPDPRPRPEPQFLAVNQIKAEDL